MQPLHRSPKIWTHTNLYPELSQLTPSWIPPEHSNLVRAAVPLYDDYVIQKVYYDASLSRFRDTFGNVVDILGWQN